MPIKWYALWPNRDPLQTRFPLKDEAVECPEGEKVSESFTDSTPDRSKGHKLHLRITTDIPQAGRVGAPGGAAGRGWARFFANRIIHQEKKKKVTVPSKASKKRRFNVFPEARTEET